jgi:mRNA-degrading endonuclease toxin of MazEF toxin-antitoxin module
VKRGEVWLVSLDPSEGHEQQGTRPVLVVSPDRFNAVTRVPIVVPITSGRAFARAAGFAVSLMNTGSVTTGIARCDQLRPIDLIARRGKKLESVSNKVMDEVLAKLGTIFS